MSKKTALVTEGIFSQAPQRKITEAETYQSQNRRMVEIWIC